MMALSLKSVPMTHFAPAPGSAAIERGGVRQTVDLDRVKANPFMRLIGLLQPPGQAANALWSPQAINRIMAWLRSVPPGSELMKESSLANTDIIQLGLFDRRGILREPHATAVQAFIWKDAEAVPDYRALVAHLRRLEARGDLERTDASNSGYPNGDNDHAQAGDAISAAPAKTMAPQNAPLSRQQRRALERQAEKHKS